VLFKNHLEHELRQLDIEEKAARRNPTADFLSLRTIVDMEEAGGGEWNASIRKGVPSAYESEEAIDDTRPGR